MVATTDTLDRAMMTLRTTELMLGDLPELAAEWEQISEGERVAWTMDWDNEMSGLAVVSRLAACGALTTDLYEGYRDLLVSISKSASILDRLRLSPPESFRHR